MMGVTVFRHISLQCEYPAASMFLGGLITYY